MQNIDINDLRNMFEKEQDKSGPQLLRELVYELEHEKFSGYSARECDTATEREFWDADAKAHENRAAELFDKLMKILKDNEEKADADG
jgi:hypothetical protein